MTAGHHIVVIEDRYEGPPEIANGGFACGMLAEHISGPLEMRLIHPVPVGEALDLEARADEARLILGQRVLVEARRTQPLDGTMPQVSLEAAREASLRHPGPAEHPFPNCYGCGPHRNEEEGLHLLPGGVSDTDVMACVWTPAARLADGAGAIPVRYVAVALDCPTYWPLIDRGEIALLGTLRLDVRAAMAPGEPHVVVSWPKTRGGRRLVGGGAVYTSDGRLVAAGEATWIKVDWDKVAAATGVAIRPDAGL